MPSCTRKNVLTIFSALTVSSIVSLCVFGLPKVAKRSLGVWPRPEKEDGDGTFLAINKKHDYRYWTNRTEEFLEPYKNMVENNMNSIYSCQYGAVPPAGKMCDIDTRQFGQCSKDNNYNYHRSSPCLFLKLNNINEPWEPEAFTIESLPKYMPDDLKEHINYTVTTNGDIAKAKSVWVSCDGSTPADKENIGPIQYISARQFPGYFFSAAGTPGYLDPLVAIHLERPQRGIIIDIECKAWAPNIKEDRSEEFISVTFNILLDD